MTRELVTGFDINDVCYVSLSSLQNTIAVCPSVCICYLGNRLNCLRREAFENRPFLPQDPQTGSSVDQVGRMTVQPFRSHGGPRSVGVLKCSSSPKGERDC
jgi:hypothetical protein